jgi:hypothetical protein
MSRLIDQAHISSINGNTHLDSFVQSHVDSTGAKPITYLGEYCNGLELPSFVFGDPAIQRLENLGPEIILLYVIQARLPNSIDAHCLLNLVARTNDIFSHVKEVRVRKSPPPLPLPCKATKHLTCQRPAKTTTSSPFCPSSTG